MAPPDRIVLLAEGLPERVVPFNVLPQFAYLRISGAVALTQTIALRSIWVRGYFSGLAILH